MTYYGGKELADAFRTVRSNTIQIAEDIPEDKYGFRATPDRADRRGARARRLRDLVAAKSSRREQEDVHHLRGLRHFMGKDGEMEKGLTTKAQIVEALRRKATRSRSSSNR